MPVYSNLTWIILGIVGLVTGFVAHLIIRSASAIETLGTLIVGIIGALAGSRLVPVGPAYYGVYLISAIVGGLLLSLLWEMLFLGNRRSHVISS